MFCVLGMKIKMRIECVLACVLALVRHTRTRRDQRYAEERICSEWKETGSIIS
jgi:hypothetical protein